MRDHILQINADFHTVLDDTASPTGEIRPVDNSPFDFRQPTVIEKFIDAPEYVPGRGIDNNWTIRKHQPKELALAATLYEPVSGRTLEVLTTMPGIQVYTANWVEKQTGKYGKTYQEQDSICLETQNFPNSPNVAHFPSSVLRPGERYDEWCVYKFSAK
ncbi:Aldose 1-epimerase [bioreactor metagenome]|uniref:Aldose 1-epimerase n=1 Tax=bioreactor metagenome TaxID=1076179 RepID=A0A645HSC5_9ZZZZ